MPMEHVYSLRPKADQSPCQFKQTAFVVLRPLYLSLLPDPCESSAASEAHCPQPSKALPELGPSGKGPALNTLPRTGLAVGATCDRLGSGIRLHQLTVPKCRGQRAYRTPLGNVPELSRPR